MSKADNKMPLARAKSLAEDLAARLLPGCERLEIVGSIRRRCEWIGDIEMVCIPKRQADLFGGEADSILDSVLDAMVRGRRLVRVKGGDKYKQFEVVDGNAASVGVCRYLCRLDLFIVTPETWGVQLAIRTGPAEFSHRLVTKRSQGGLMPDHMQVKEGRLINVQDHCVCDTPEEDLLFMFMGLSWMEPWERV